MEVLVFIAAETLADSYLCTPSHLAKKWIVLREDVGELSVLRRRKVALLIMLQGR